MASRSLRLLAVAAVAVLLSISGAVAFTALEVDVLPVDQGPDADALVADVLENHGDVETVQAARISEYEIYDSEGDEPRTGEMTGDVWKHPPDRSRVDVVSSTRPGEGAGDVWAVDGSTLYSYDASAQRLIVDDNWRGEAIYYWPDVYETDLEAEYVGTDTVDGRETYVLEIEPAAGETATGISLLVGDTEFTFGAGEPATRNATRTTTWWIDAEHRFPIKERLEADYDESDEHPLQWDRSVWTVTYEDVRFDEAIDDNRFEFEPPADTETDGPTEPLDVSTVAEADAAAPFTVREPPVPDRFDPAYVSGTEFGSDVSVTLLYRDGDEGDTIAVRLSESSFDRADVLEEEVGEHDGTLAETGLGTGYSWQCDGTYYEIVADDGRVAVELAESVDCS
ncbi:LolA family protein [Natronobacterium texcoconense]|uniref:Outer membrane lipoprotein-sorting protein n=1 Tax=Natronobacterium texcoconense TaxID=1095778 RepID=A0A1H1GKE5_NATTX|nr:hypothetical protein [Natronobacterium texcoconense]SDR13356.1 Outer membrane lipoprotein-sorting protein [Natronobacterium texcoconense]